MLPANPVRIPASWKHSDCFKRAIFHAFVFAAILYVVPYAHDYGQKLKTQHFVVPYRVVNAPKLYPPVAVGKPVAFYAAELHLFGSNFFSPRRRDKRHRLIVQARGNHKSGTLPRADLVKVCKGLPVSVNAFPASHNFGSRLHSKAAVTSGVDKYFRLNAVSLKSSVRTHPCRCYLIAIGLGFI